MDNNQENERLPIEKVLSLINNDGWNLLLLPYLKQQIELGKEALTVSSEDTTERELYRINSIRAVIGVYRGLMETIESWVIEINEEKDGDR